MTTFPIDPARITAVLCHDGWHDVMPGTFGFSFERAVDRDDPGALPDLYWGPIGAVYALRVAGTLDVPDALLDTRNAPARIFRDVVLHTRPAP